MTDEAPVLSVVVAIVDGGVVLARCLEALARQVDPPPLEVIVPYDDSVGATAALAGDHPGVRFVPLGRLVRDGEPDDAFGRHQLYDRRRAAGLRAARGRLVALLEDRGWPRPDWAAAFAGLHAARPHAAIGGAIECAATDGLLRAIFRCDFGRYRPPFAEREAGFASDVNVCYKRELLESVRAVWADRFQEPQVHEALRRCGHALLLSPLPRVVEQRLPLPLGAALDERLQWGRTYGRIRGRDGGRSLAVLRALAAPAVPLVLLLRQWRQGHDRGDGRGELAATLPLTLALLTAWAAGEAWGGLEAALGGARTASPTTANPT